MRISKVDILLAVAVIGFVPTNEAAAQALPGVRVSGAELEAWQAEDQMAVAGIGANSCHWIVKGPWQARSQTVYCPNSTPFTVTGQAEIVDNRLCAKFIYPDGSSFNACQEVFKVGENKYEARVGGVKGNTFYRLIR